MSLFLLVQILCIIIGTVLLGIAFDMLRPREEEQKLIQDRFLFYLIFGLCFFLISFLLGYIVQ